MIAAVAAAAAMAASPADGERLHADIETYVSHGNHLVGHAGAERSASWLEARLATLGYSTERQAFRLRQFRLHGQSLRAGGRERPVALQWWPPAIDGRITVEGQIGDGPGRIVVIPTEVGDQSYLTPAIDARVRAAAADGAAAVLLQTRTSLGADGPYLFNAREAATPWPVPVMSIGHADGMDLSASKARVRLTVRGRYTAVTASNVVARLDRPGTDRTVVISTPYTGWGPCGGERGPGIAMFLAFADWARANIPYDLVFIATAGHEVGHSGMATFLKSDRAPPPAGTVLWLHLGASIATYAAPGSREPNRATRYVLYSAAMAEPALARFRDAFVPIDTAVNAFGEVADVKKAGYPRHVGFAGYGPHHHLPTDLAQSTGPDILADAANRILALFQATVTGTPRD
ncbi:MAG: hypothetical protein INF91_08125 [Alphaproteobacteria bacterium]|nr:hypothetical protein [Alphaproteobacteria bacterium]